MRATIFCCRRQRRPAVRRRQENARTLGRDRQTNRFVETIIGKGGKKDAAMAEAFFSLYCLVKNTLPPKVFFKFFKDLDLFCIYPKTAPKCTVALCLCP